MQRTLVLSLEPRHRPTMRTNELTADKLVDDIRKLTERTTSLERHLCQRYNHGKKDKTAIRSLARLVRERTALLSRLRLLDPQLYDRCTTAPAIPAPS